MNGIRKIEVRSQPDGRAELLVDGSPRATFAPSEARDVIDGLERHLATVDSQTRSQSTSIPPIRRGRLPFSTSDITPAPGRT